ncbi:hypothetical protein GOP47_0004531 [Adiantum capillus-veneris]|uniref:Uncharacterized protein n=1 Tax=Adiantum capillus-veneris TaxID=13818 RepID=A0A9D4V915_ADICA|nr:hypothetical protein GOP47_0004531 [Adiantum capillus-veneris]
MEPLGIVAVIDLTEDWTTTTSHAFSHRNLFLCTKPRNCERKQGLLGKKVKRSQKLFHTNVGVMKQPVDKNSEEPKWVKVWACVSNPFLKPLWPSTTVLICTQCDSEQQQQQRDCGPFSRICHRSQGCLSHHPAPAPAAITDEINHTG